MSSKIASEFFGSAFLLMIVVGSGIMGESLSQGNAAITLLANSLATGAGLYVLIQCLGPVSGAHFNPAVSFIEFLWKRLKPKDLLSYWLAQVLGAIVGVLTTHFIFAQDILQISTKDRNTVNLWTSEFIASFGLIATIALAGRKNPNAAPMSIAAFITSAYWFTSSTSFANPAVTMARSLTNSFAGIAPSGILPFIIAQLLGALTAYAVIKSLK